MFNLLRIWSSQLTRQIPRMADVSKYLRDATSPNISDVRWPTSDSSPSLYLFLVSLRRGFTRLVMPARWTLPQARRAATASPWTKELRHLEPLPKHWSDRRKVPGALQNVTRPKDRIKWWNIVPGDQVKIRNSRINEILEVAQINKLTNMVYLKVRVFSFSSTSIS